MKYRVLFLCATNGLQSPMAEAFLNALDSEHFDVSSAGLVCGTMHSTMVEVMKEVGVNLDGRLAKAVQDVAGRSFDFVITLCDRARARCPDFPGADRVHWRLDDPLAAPDHIQQIRKFQTLRDQIAHRVRLFALVQARSA